MVSPVRFATAAMIVPTWLTSSARIWAWAAGTWPAVNAEIRSGYSHSSLASTCSVNIRRSAGSSQGPMNTDAA